MARVLVLGAGVFGTLAANILRERGHAPVVVSRRTGVDARDVASVSRALDGCDALLHAAGPFAEQPPAAAEAAARAGAPYADLSDDRGFSARVRDLPSGAPLLTGMSTTPAVAEALAALARRGDASLRATCAMYVGGANRQGPATMRFAARSRLPGRSLTVDLPGVGPRRTYPARAFFDGDLRVAVGGLAGLGWRAPALLRAFAPIAHRLPRPGNDTSGSIVAIAGAHREGLHAPAGGQRLAVLPAVWALEKALRDEAPKRPALPEEWVDPEELVTFLARAGFTRTSA